MSHLQNGQTPRSQDVNRPRRLSGLCLDPPPLSCSVSYGEFCRHSRYDWREYTADVALSILNRVDYQAAIAYPSYRCAVLLAVSIPNRAWQLPRRGWHLTKQRQVGTECHLPHEYFCISAGHEAYLRCGTARLRLTVAILGKARDQCKTCFLIFDWH